jgi:hypothetical protein
MAILGVIFLAASWQSVASGEQGGPRDNNPAILEGSLAANQRAGQELEALRQELTRMGELSAAADQKLSDRLELMEKRLAALGQRDVFADQGKDATYMVRAGDSLSTIAENFNIPAASLRKWNNIGPRGDIRVGQRLRLSGQ